MQIAAWNIQQGGGDRRPAIADAAATFNADVIVLPEYQRIGGDTELESLLADLGYPGWVDSGATGKLLGVAMAARAALR